jgi:2-dehydro-3-deoxyphosphogluconate aldolase/(4S)-4-hydroxy-2-oxoglutarate aldolase
MIPKLDILNRIVTVGLVAVVRAETPEQAMKIADAVIDGGCPAIEVTFTVPGAAHVLEALAARYLPSDLILGAGTVLDPETARIAILAGAKYIVTPSLNEETVRLCNRYQVPVMPGAMSIRDVIAAMEAGADIIKIFPGEVFGPGFIKSIRGPLPQAPLMPTGGVDIVNVGEWIKAGAVAVGAGGSLTAGAKRGDYSSITALAAQFIQKIREAREG